MEKLFEIAIREKYRWPYKGLVGIEDLWDISLTGLDSIFKLLNTEAKKSQEESLLEVKTRESTKLSNQIEIIKYVVATKQAEADARRQAADKAKQKEKIQEILARKQEEGLEKMSPEQLQEMLSKLG